MSTSPPVTNDKGLRELTDKKSSKYLLQQVKQGLTISTHNAHLQVLTMAEADQCCHPYSATDRIIQNVSLREICSRYVFLDAATLAEVFPCFFLGCKANARVILAKTGHGPHSSKIVVLYVLLFLLFYVLFVCKCVLPPGDNPIAVNKYIISCVTQGYCNRLSSDI